MNISGSPDIVERNDIENCASIRIPDPDDIIQI